MAFLSQWVVGSVNLAGAFQYSTGGSLGAVTNEPNAPRPHPPLTEDRIRAAWVVEPPVHDAPIELAEYDPEWPALFQREKERIRKALRDRMLQLVHVGSTSVPGLAAKPIIDICLVVADPSDEAAYVPALEAAGYTLRIREPEWFEHRLFKGPTPT